MKKLTKRKMYQKRRKKEKEVKRKTTQRLEKQNKQQTASNNNKKYQQHHNQQWKTFGAQQYPQNTYTEGMRQWWQTYCTAMQYHREQRRQWKEGNILNDMQCVLRTPTDMELLEKYAEEYETSSEDEEEDEEAELQEQKEQQMEQNTDDVQTDTVDIEYLKFLEITHKHREELRLKREAEC